MQGKRWLMGAAAAALLLTMTAGCGDKGGQSGGGSGKLPINSVSLPGKAGWGRHQDSGLRRLGSGA